MFANNKELFDFINSLSEKLNLIGEEEWSLAFKKSMSISFMPGELLGEVKLTLKKFQKTRIPRKLNLEKEINAAIESLDQTLDR